MSGKISDKSIADFSLSKYYFFCALTSLVTAFLLMSACSKKLNVGGMPFDMDKIAFSDPSQKIEDWKDKGVNLARQKNYSEAIEAFSNYIEQTPKDSFGYNALAVCYKNIGDTQSAMKNFEKALDFSNAGEERAKIFANIGNMYFSAAKPQAALGFYKDAAAQFDDNPLYVIMIARTFVSLNDFDRARKALSQAESKINNLEQYERDEDKGQGYYLLAQSYAALNEEKKLFESLDRALRANPGRFLSKIEKDSLDERSLFFTLKDDDRLNKLVRHYAKRLSN